MIVVHLTSLIILPRADDPDEAVKVWFSAGEHGPLTSPTMLYMLATYSGQLNRVKISYTEGGICVQLTDEWQSFELPCEALTRIATMVRTSCTTAHCLADNSLAC